MSGMNDRLQRLVRKPIRVCYTMHECLICNEGINVGQRYFDGGHGRRAHEDCVRRWFEQRGCCCADHEIAGGHLDGHCPLANTPTCPTCDAPMTCAKCTGRRGGLAKVSKGFASKRVQSKAQATRKRKKGRTE